MNILTKEYVNSIANNFQYEGELLDNQPYGSGHINDTFLLTFSLPNGTTNYSILQRMNTEIFAEPVKLMENIVNITSFLRKKIICLGGNPNRETINVIPAKDGKSYYKDTQDMYWRSYVFITGATSFDQVQNPRDFYESAVAFGHFQNILSDYPANTLNEIIPGFHDTKSRFQNFLNALQKDSQNRAQEVKEEIKFVLEHENLATTLGRLQENGEIPLRVTHNDTKLNNIMIDDKTRKGICVIDLDTVMPGLAINDFGDSIRFGASTAAEDETDLERVSCDLNLFELYVKGFLKGCDGSLTQKEIELLPLGAKVMTYECGMRFLTDYLEGDYYFKIHRMTQNLDRCRTQFKLVRDMEMKWDQMQQIIRNYI